MKTFVLVLSLFATIILFAPLAFGQDTAGTAIKDTVTLTERLIFGSPWNVTRCFDTGEDTGPSSFTKKGDILLQYIHSSSKTVYYRIINEKGRIWATNMRGWDAELFFREESNSWEGFSYPPRAKPLQFFLWPAGGKEGKPSCKN